MGRARGRYDTHIVIDDDYHYHGNMHHIVIDYDLILESIQPNHKRSKRCLQERERENAIVMRAGSKVCFFLQNIEIASFVVCRYLTFPCC